MKYMEFINLCKNRDYSGLFCQKHHIIPKSNGGNNSDTNIILLSIYDHFWAHYWYAKEYNKCLCAPNMILHSINAKKSFTEEQFNECYEIALELNREGVSFALKGKKKTPEHCKKLSEQRKGKPSPRKGIKTGYIPKSTFKKGNTPWNKGIPLTEVAKQKMITTKTLNPSRPWLGKVFSKSHRLALSLAHKGQFTNRNKGKQYKNIISGETGGLYFWRCKGVKYPYKSNKFQIIGVMK